MSNKCVFDTSARKAALILLREKLLNLGHGKLKKVMENHRILKASKSMNLVLIVITKFMDIVIWLAKCFLSLLKVCE